MGGGGGGVGLCGPKYTLEDYSFLYVNLMSRDKRKMLMTIFNHYLNPS